MPRFQEPSHLDTSYDLVIGKLKKEKIFPPLHLEHPYFIPDSYNNSKNVKNLNQTLQEYRKLCLKEAKERGFILETDRPSLLKSALIDRYVTETVLN